MSGVAKRLFEALLSSVDEEKLQEKLQAALRGELGGELADPPADVTRQVVLPSSDAQPASDSNLGAGPSGSSSAGDAGTGAEGLHDRLLLADILGDDIVGARPGDASFPVRVLLGKLGEHLGDETAFALANGLSFYFRATMDDEARVRVGLEVSRLYYRFAGDNLEEAERRAVSPLIARLMNGDLERLRFEAVDHDPVFESAKHERAAGADASSSNISLPESFLCRVAANGMVRFKAVVNT